MEQLRERHGVEVVDRAVGVAALRLASRPETRSLVPPLEAALAEVLARDVAHKRAERERMAATAEVEYADDCVDGWVMRLSRKLDAVTDGDRKAALFSGLFEQAPSKVTKLEQGEQDRVVKRILAALCEDPLYAEFTSERQGLLESQAQLDAALKKRDELYRKEDEAGIALRQALEHCRRTYNNAQAQVTVLCGVGTALSESFFIPLRRKRGDEAA